MTTKGFYVNSKFWQNSDVRNLSPVQRGILADIFSILAVEYRKNYWGFLADTNPKPLSERSIRAELGDKAPIALTTWRTAKEAFIERGILKTVRIGTYEFLYCPVFVEMNSFETSHRFHGMINQEERVLKKNVAIEIWMGFNPDDKRPDTELDIWGRVCRRWIELSGVVKPPISIEMPLSAKTNIKSDLVAIIQEMGIDNALHEMDILFDLKKRAGGRISTVEYFLARWRSKDWLNRFDEESGVGIQERRAMRERLLETVETYKRLGTVKTLSELLAYLPNADQKLLREVAETVGFK